MAEKRYQQWTPQQPFLLPPSPLEWLPEGHLAHFILDVVGVLDLSPILDAYQRKDGRGTRAYDPRMMVALLLYGYSVGVYSSRKLERATYEDVAFRVIGGGSHPDHTQIARFRREWLDVISGLFLQVLQLCREAGMVKLGLVAVDGTKVQANASKHKAMSYARMKEMEKRLQAEIDGLLARAEQTDAGEDARYGVGGREEDLPAELRRRENRLAVIREAKARLEQEAAEARARALRKQARRAAERSERDDISPAEQKRAATSAKNKAAKARKLDPDRDDNDNDPPMTGDGLPLHEPKVKPDGTPDDKAQMNFTDADSRILESGGGVIQGYNCQAAVDDANQIIVGQAVSNKSPDNGNLVPLVRQVQDNCGEPAKAVVADAGYWTPNAPTQSEELGTSALISTQRRRHWDTDDTVTEGEPPEHASARDKMRHKVRTQEGRQLYARRKAVVEPVFGQVKDCRGYRRFLLRGLDGVAGEWALLCTVHNLLKLFRAPVAGALAAA